LIEDFKTYKPLLSAIKHEYEMMLVHQREKIRELEPLKVLGNSRKYPCPTMDSFHVLPPPSPLAFGNSKMCYPTPHKPSDIDIMFIWSLILAINSISTITK